MNNPTLMKIRRGTCKLSLLLLLLLWASVCGIVLGQQEFPGGELELRPALVVADKGQHPRVLVQTVPHLDVTATCLAIRYRTPGQSEPASTAHLYEHLLFRSIAGKPAGALLLRTEELGAQMRAEVGPSILLFSELVPAEGGLDSLDLQLARLRAIPSDPSGLEIERGNIGLEIRSALASPEDQARREVLKRFGLVVDPEGELESLRQVDNEKLTSFLQGLNLEKDVVVTIIGPQTNRQVRQHLARNLQPLLPRRTTDPARPALKTPDKKPLLVTGARTSQVSHFVEHSGGSPILASTARALLQKVLGPDHQVEVIQEDASVWRVDISPPPTAEWLPQGTLDKLSLDQLQARISNDWLEQWESPLDRAEMMATSLLQWGKVSTPPQLKEMPALVAEASKLIRAAEKDGVKLELKSSSGTSASLFPYKRVANRGNSPGEVMRDELPNGIQVSYQNVESWPIVAVSGFFRLKRELTTEQSLALEAELRERAGGDLEFEVVPGGLFFHTWCQKSKLAVALADLAKVLKGLAEVETPLTELAEGRSSGPSPMEKFFVLPFQGESAGQKVSSRELLDPNNAQLVVVGAIDDDLLDRGLRPAWSGWFRDKKPAKLFPRKDRSGQSTVASSQTVATPGGPPMLLIGFEGPTRANPDFLAFNLALQTLAGRPTTSMLARFLRDRERTVDSLRVFPLTGSADPAASPTSQQTWVIALRLSSGEVDAEEVISVVRQRLQRLAEEGLPEAELRRTRAYLKGRLKLSTATTRGRARVLAHSEFYRLSESYSEDYAGLYDSLKLPQVKATCSKYFAEPNTRWLYLKPAGIPADPAKKEG